MFYYGTSFSFLFPSIPLAAMSFTELGLGFRTITIFCISSWKWRNFMMFSSSLVIIKVTYYWWSLRIHKSLKLELIGCGQNVSKHSRRFRSQLFIGANQRIVEWFTYGSKYVDHWRNESNDKLNEKQFVKRKAFAGSRGAQMWFWKIYICSMFFRL